jgi:hypothetical protein
MADLGDAGLTASRDVVLAWRERTKLLAPFHRLESQADFRGHPAGASLALGPAMALRFPRYVAPLLVLLAFASRGYAMPVIDQTEAIDYRLEKLTDANRDLTSRFGGPEIALLEKLNRADLKHLQRLNQLIVPSSWRAELEYSPFPSTYPAASAAPKLLIVDQPSQAFAAYEYGQQVHWGPVSSGRQARPTPSGLYHLNWRDPHRGPCGGYKRPPARCPESKGACFDRRW